jgi:N-acetylmuramoyl-L-alanine amidase
MKEKRGKVYYSIKDNKKEKIVGTIQEFNNPSKSKKKNIFERLYNESGRYLIIKKRALVFFMIFVLIVSCFAFIPTVIAATPSGLLTVVIDAGHGGIDPGCEGSLEGSNERELNLLYANTLKKYFESYGIRVVMTRTTTDGLYSALAPNKKKDDMKKRKEIIEKSKADIVVSIHMNAFPAKSSRGAHVFYNPDNEVSKSLADNIQSSLIASLPYARKAAAVGDYYILNCTNVPAVIVECGFLSNAEEEILLRSSDYREKVCYAILCGVIKYLG